MFTSPLARAHDTAREIADATGTGHPVALDDLLELDTGLFSGKRLDEIAQEFPVEWARFQRESWETVKDAESIASLTKRAQSTWRRLIAEANAGRPTPVCVTHVGLLQWIIRASFGVDGFQWMPVLRVGNCGICCLSVTPVAADGDLPASFFAEWTLLNHLPYEPSE